VEGRLQTLKSVRRARRRPSQAGTLQPGARWQLVSNGRRRDFRAVLLPADAAPTLTLDEASAAALGLHIGEPVLAAALDWAAPAGAEEAA